MTAMARMRFEARRRLPAAQLAHNSLEKLYDPGQYLSEPLKCRGGADRRRTAFRPSFFLLTTALTSPNRFPSVWSRFSICPSLDSVRLVTIRAIFLYPPMYNCYLISATDESGVDFTSSPIRSLLSYPIQALCSADQSVILRRLRCVSPAGEGEAPVIPPLPPDSHYPSHFNPHESRRRWIRMLIDNRSTHITPIDQLPLGRRRPVCYLGASTQQRMRSLDPLAAPKTARPSPYGSS